MVHWRHMTTFSHVHLACYKPFRQLLAAHQCFKLGILTQRVQVTLKVQCRSFSAEVRTLNCLNNF